MINKGYFYIYENQKRINLADLSEIKVEGEEQSVLQRKKIEDQILSNILGFVDTFINGVIGE